MKLPCKHSPLNTGEMPPSAHLPPTAFHVPLLTFANTTPSTHHAPPHPPCPSCILPHKTSHQACLSPTTTQHKTNAACTFTTHSKNLHRLKILVLQHLYIPPTSPQPLQSSAPIHSLDLLPMVHKGTSSPHKKHLFPQHPPKRSHQNTYRKISLIAFSQEAELSLNHLLLSHKTPNP